MFEPIIVDVPAGLKVPPATPHFAQPDRSGGRSVTGFEQIVRGVGGFWQVELDLRLRGVAQYAAWQGVLAQLEGRANVLRLPLCGCWQSKLWRDALGIETSDAELPFSDEALFSDGAGFSADLVPTAGTVGDAPLGEYRVTFDVAEGFAVVPGMWFSVADRFYRVRAVLDRDGSRVTVAVQGLLRAAIPAGSVVELARPTGLFRLRSNDVGEPEAVVPGRSWTVPLKLDEARLPAVYAA